MFPSRSGWCHKLNFLALWLCYKSLFDVGQTFLWFQWDILLLETGFLCIIVAPLTTFQKFGMVAKKNNDCQCSAIVHMFFFPGLSNHRRTSPWDRVTLFLVRWLLFRMMFSSGAVKLLSQSVSERASLERSEEKYEGLRDVKSRS